MAEARRFSKQKRNGFLEKSIVESSFSSKPHKLTVFFTLCDCLIRSVYAYPDCVSQLPTSPLPQYIVVHSLFMEEEII